MKFIKRNYGWMLVAILAILPLFIIFGMVNIDYANGLSISLIEDTASEGRSTLEMLYHISGSLPYVG